LLRRLAAGCLLTFLVACGGGGGGSGGTASNQPVASTHSFQFKSAWGGYQAQSATFPITLSGTATNAALGNFAITGSGTINQTSAIASRPAIDGSGTTVQAIMVTRVYQFTAIVNGIPIQQTLTDVAYYDPSTYVYMGGTFTDSTGASINNVPIAWSPPPTTLACCAGGYTFYQTAIAVNNPVTHDILLAVAADTANSVIIDLTDNAAAGASRRYRLDSTNKLTPISEDLKVIAYVLTTNGTYTFNATVTFNF
jgi:hypothetical protein